MGCPQGWYHVDLQLLPVKGVYFFTLASVSALFSYLSLFMKEIGLTMAETGIIWGVMPFMGGIFRIMAGMLADKLQCHKSMLITASLMSGVIHCLLLFVPPANQHLPPAYVQLSCNPAGTLLRSCPYGQNRSYDGQSEYIVRKDFNEINYLLDDLPIPVIPTRCVLECESAHLGNGRACFAGNQNGVNSSCQSLNPLTSVPAAITRIIVSVRTNDGMTFSSRLVNDTKLTFSGDAGIYNIERFLLHDSRDHSFQEMKCAQKSLFYCKTSCELFERSQCRMPYLDEDLLKTPAFGRTFWIFSVIFFFGQIAFSPIFNLIDAVTYDFLGEKRHLWGKQRLWGTVGNGMFAISSGLLMDFFSQGQDKTDYTAAFGLFVACEVLCAVCCAFYRVSKDVHCKAPRFSEVLTLMARGDMLLLLIMVVLFGMWHGIQETFLFLHLEKIKPEVETPRILFGLCLLMNSLPQIVLFFFSGDIIKKFGHVNCIALATFCFGVRQVGYTIVPDPWYVLPFEGLNALTFGLFYAAVSAYGSIITPAGLHGSVQGIIGSLYFGVGRGLGCLEAGPLIESIGTSDMFRYHGYSAFLAAAVYIYVQKCHIDPSMVKQANKLVVERNKLLKDDTKEVGMTEMKDDVNPDAVIIQDKKY